MVKIIYLPGYAKKNLETSDDSKVWAKPIPFSTTPGTDEFPIQVSLSDEDSQNNSLLTGGKLYPARLSDVDSFIERLSLVELSKPLATGKPVSQLDRVRYRAFNDCADDWVWASFDGNDVAVKGTYTFNMDSNAFHRNVFNMMHWVLGEGAGIYLNKAPFNPDDEARYTYYNRKFVDSGLLPFNDTDRVSADGSVYKLFETTDIGRGRAVFLRKKGKRIEFLTEDHRDSVEEWLLYGDGKNRVSGLLAFAPDLDFRILYRHNYPYLANEEWVRLISSYQPALRDFASDFDVNEKGRIVPLKPLDKVNPFKRKAKKR